MEHIHRLYRSQTDRMFAGICGGLGEYCHVDPTALRFLFVVVTVLSGFFPGVIAYIVGIFIIPNAAAH